MISRLIAVSLALLIATSLPIDLTCGQSPPAALEAIESERGGRHWIDAETDPPKHPDQSLAAIQIEQGYRIELVAAEPLVHDPVAITFDRLGRMFVVEYSDYPTGKPDGTGGLSTIALLSDTDQDGTIDQRIVFADDLDFAHSLMAYRDGLLVGANTEILYLRDTDGDDVADVRETLFDGFTPPHPQMQIGCPQWGLDNRVYWNYGVGNVAAGKDPDQRVAIPRKDFWFDPVTDEFGADSGLGQFGNTIDRWGHRFYCLNRNPIMTTLLPPEILNRNPFHIVGTPFYDVGKAGGATRVYPLVKMKSNYLSHAGTHTAACGTTAYLGEFGSEGLRDSVFVCEPIGHLVTRSVIESEGVRLVASRARARQDFLASTDTWFRPSSLANGPDGALYLADMYRLWVEHPKFLPPEIAAKLDWRAGDDRGRIYRILPADASIRPFDPPDSIDAEVALLSDPNGWRRMLGQRLLVQRQDQRAAHSLRTCLQDPAPVTRLHALWTLHGLGQLTADDVLTAVVDADPHVRGAALRLAHRWIDQDDVFDRVTAAVNDPDTVVRFEAGLTLSASDAPAVSLALTQLARSDGADPLFADGLLTSCKERSGEILAALMADSRSADIDTQLVTRLATIVGARGDVAELGKLLQLIIADGSTTSVCSDRHRMAMLDGLARGLPRHRGALGRIALDKLIAEPPTPIAGPARGMQAMLDRYQQIALDPQRDLEDRLAAVNLLGYQSFTQTADVFDQLLSGDQPGTLQAACLSALEQQGTAEAAAIAIGRWSEIKPAARSHVFSFLLKRTLTTRLALDAMRAGSLDSSGVTIDQRVLLLKHADPAIRELATELFGGAVSSDRQQVIDQHRSALSLPGSSAAGRQVFLRTCANCHRRDGVGQDVGPDLSDVRNRSKSALLHDILDPNAKVEPRWTSCSILTVEGQVLTGLLGQETTDAIVLHLPAGKRQAIGRAEIEEIKISDVSLMPEGIEKEVNVQQMADLLEYLSP